MVILIASVLPVAELEGMLGAHWQIYLVIAAAALVILPALFFKSPIGTMLQFSGAAWLAFSLWQLAVRPMQEALFLCLFASLGLAMMGLGAMVRHLAHARHEGHVQNLKTLKMLAAQVPKKPKPSVRQQIEGGQS